MDLQTSPIEGTSSDKHDILDQLARKPLDADELEAKKILLKNMTRLKSCDSLFRLKDLLCLYPGIYLKRTLEVQALSGETCTVETSFLETVRGVKAEACEKLCLSDKNYTLVHNGIGLDDMSFFHDLCIFSGSKLQLLPRIGSGLGDSVKRLFAYYHERAQRLVEWFPDMFMDMSRALTEKDLSRISQAIGSGWQHLGTELGISKAAIDQIREDNSKTSMRIFNMLRQWSIKASVNATVNTLHNAMKNCRKVTFDMKDIERVFAGI